MFVVDLTTYSALLLYSLSCHEFALDPGLLPVLRVANADIFELLYQLLLAYLLLLVIVTQHLQVQLPFILLEGKQRVGIVLLRNELVLIKLLFLDVVECDDVLAFHILCQKLFEFYFLDVVDVGWASRQIVENIADLQIMKIQIPFVQFGIGFL